VDENPQDKVGESVSPTTNPASSSQKDDVSNKEPQRISSQKDIPSSTQTPKGDLQGRDTQPKPQTATKTFSTMLF